jgi:hypothetical protein
LRGDGIDGYSSLIECFTDVGLDVIGRECRPLNMEVFLKEWM